VEHRGFALGHYKGALAINAYRDIPLLRQIRDSTVISHSQLFRFMSLGHYESRRDVFNWRLRRLVQHGFVKRHQFSHVSPDYVYSISNPGSHCLEQHGDFYLPSVAASLNTRIDSSHFSHDLQLNDIHLALLEDGTLRSWIPERKLRSLTDHILSPYEKAYDAVVEVGLGSGQLRFALEYEQTQKEMRRYLEVRQALERERNIGLVLYLVPTSSLVANISQHFKGCRQRVCFALVQEFKKDLFETQVRQSGGILNRSLRETLLAAPSQLTLSIS
jgi:Replication-relaxation